MAHISDVCNHLDRNNIQSSFYTCINTDKLSIPKQFIGLLQNYAPTIATITAPTSSSSSSSSSNSTKGPANQSNSSSVRQQQNQQLSPSQRYNQTSQKLFNIEDESNDHADNKKNVSSIHNLSNQISSLWIVCIEHNYSKNFLLRINPLDLQSTCIHQQQQQEYHHQQMQMSFHCNALYAIIWTHDQFNDCDDSFYNPTLRLDDNDEEEEEIDYDAKEIVWSII